MALLTLKIDGRWAMGEAVGGEVGFEPHGKRNKALQDSTVAACSRTRHVQLSRRMHYKETTCKMELDLLGDIAVPNNPQSSPPDMSMVTRVTCERVKEAGMFCVLIFELILFPFARFLARYLPLSPPSVPLSLS